MAYIGRQLARGENKLFDDISSSFNGSTTVFNLTVSSVATSTATPYQLFVSLGGVMQKPNTDFTTAGNQITFTTAPAAGLSCWIMMQGDTIDNAAVADASITPSKISGTNFAFSGDLRLKDADGSHYVGFASPTTVTTNKVWTLPAADGGASTFLQTNGSGVLSWSGIGGASGIDFNDNVKARFGTGNDLEIFHNASNSVINDAGTGDLLLQVGGSTKATVSSTGFGVTGALTVSTNATISGNLTVSGTTTTVDSVTLSVKDKNIEMGVVSSPSDTTADGGGITLKGASDKSFNWVNATDAWTSSEHIHLIDNKKLFVGGASGTTDGLEIVHNGSNSILNDSGTGTLQLQLGGSTKLEVTSGGINVTGAISVGGSPLASGNTVDLVADGAIAAGKPVIIKSNGKAEQIGLSSTVITSPTASLVSQRYLDGQAVRNYTPRVAVDDVNEIMMVTYVEESSGEHKCQLFKTNASNSDNLDVVGAESTIESTDAGTENEWEDLCFVSSSRFMYVYYHGSFTRAKIGTISGSGTTWSVSWSAAHTIDGVSTANYGGMKLCKIGTNRVAILAKAKNSNCRWTDDAPGILIVDITGTNTVTYRNYHSPSSQVFNDERYGSLTYNSTDDLLLVSWQRSNSLGRITALKVAAGTAATVTETSGGYTTIENSVYSRNVTTWDSENNKFIHAYEFGNSIRTKVVTVNSSSLAMTVGSAVDYSLGSGVTASKGMAICMSSSDSVYLTYCNNSKNPLQLLDSSFDGSAVSWAHGSPSTTIDGYAQGVRQVSLPSTRIMIVFGLFGLSNRGYIFNTKTLNSTTNLSTDKRNFIGFAEDAINDTATGTIKLRGNVVGGQSGLTIGTLYEVQSAGTLNANWASNSVGLRALSATTGQIIENTGI